MIDKEYDPVVDSIDPDLLMWLMSEELKDQE